MTVSVHCHIDDAEHFTSGGIMCLKQLVLDLKSIGIESHLSTPSHPFPNPDVAIYAEGVHGNPLNGKICVKWLLYHQPNDLVYGKEEIIFRLFDNYSVKPENESQVKGQLYVANCNLSVWKGLGLTREGSCFVVRKGAHKVTREIMEKLHGSVCIENYPDEKFLIRQFNRHNIFVSFDHYSMLSAFAALCGCLSIVIPEKDLSAEQWRSGLSNIKYGVAYGFDDIEYAKSTQHLIRDHVNSLNNSRFEYEKNFINFCKSIL